MSLASDLIQIVEQAGGKFLLDGDDRLGIAPRDAASSVLEQLRTNKREIRALLKARMEESFRQWLAVACKRSNRWFTNMTILHCEFCRWQSEHRDTQPILSDFRRLLETADLLIAPVEGVMLVSGLGFKSDIDATPAPPKRQKAEQPQAIQRRN